MLNEWTHKSIWFPTFSSGSKTRNCSPDLAKRAAATNPTGPAAIMTMG